jgi:hypothetical protein
MYTLSHTHMYILLAVKCKPVLFSNVLFCDFGFALSLGMLTIAAVPITSLVAEVMLHVLFDGPLTHIVLEE